VYTSERREGEPTDLELSAEHRELVHLVRHSNRDVIAPQAAEADATGEYPVDYLQAFKETGLLGVAMPGAYGGAGLLKETELAVKASNDCLQTTCAVGYMEEYPMARGGLGL